MKQRNIQQGQMLCAERNSFVQVESAEIHSTDIRVIVIFSGLSLPGHAFTMVQSMLQPGTNKPLAATPKLKMGT